MNSLAFLKRFWAWALSLLGLVGGYLALREASLRGGVILVGRGGARHAPDLGRPRGRETTVDFCPRNPVLTWALGGLNFQIEHHLFPLVPHTHYPRIAEIVQRNCVKHCVRYSSQPSLQAALHSHFLHLRAMGRLGLRPEIEMG